MCTKPSNQAWFPRTAFEALVSSLWFITPNRTLRSVLCCRPYKHFLHVYQLTNTAVASVNHKQVLYTSVSISFVPPGSCFSGICRLFGSSVAHVARRPHPYAKAALRGALLRLAGRGSGPSSPPPFCEKGAALTLSEYFLLP